MALLASSQVAADQPERSRPRTLLLLPLEARGGVTGDTAALASMLLAAELRRRPDLRVVTLQELETAMTMEQRRQVVDCGKESCVAEIAAALHADETVSGTVGRMGDSLVVGAVRMSNGAVVLGSATRVLSTPDEAALGAALDPLVAELMGSPHPAAQVPVAPGPPGAPPAEPVAPPPPAAAAVDASARPDARAAPRPVAWTLRMAGAAGVTLTVLTALTAAALVLGYGAVKAVDLMASARGQPHVLPLTLAMAANLVLVAGLMALGLSLPGVGVSLAVLVTGLLVPA